MAECNDIVLEETFVKHCSLCSENSDFKTAVKLCVDCKSYLCDECVKCHSKFPLFKSHKVLDDLEEDSGEIKVDDKNDVFDYCASYEGEVIDSYCIGHDTICCTVCVIITHRSCENVLTLEEAAKGICEKNELNETKQHLNTYISRIKIEKEKRSKNISQLDEQKLSILNEIDMFQESIMKKIARMTEVTREEVRSKHKELVNVVKKDVERLEKVTSITEKNLKTLNNVKGQSDTKVFTNIKNIEKFAKDAEIFVNDLSSKLPIRKLDYCIDYEWPHNDTSLKTFGHFTEDENIPANILQLSERYKGVFDVKLESDEKDCTISGICVLENGMYVISDFANRKLKRFNRNYELYDSIKLIGAPTSACLSGSQQVVLALCDKKLIQFVSCSDKLSVDYSFSTIDNCNGVFFDSENNELVVCCSSSICIYNKTGTLLKLIENDETGEHLFSDVKNCVLMPGSETIYSVDVQKGLIASTKDGKKLWTFNNTKLEKPWSICLISCQHLLVACSLSCIILQVSKDGIFISESTSESHREEIGMNKLYTLVYDKRHSTVSLGGTSNEVCTYRLCRK